MKAAGIIQARMGSTRLPGKAMADLGGAPMLARCVNRVRRAQLLNETIVATTTLPADDPIAALCEEKGWSCFRGSEDDLLDRYYQAATAHHIDVVVRITSDCPVIDPRVIDEVVLTFEENQPGAEYVSNIFPERTFPRGLDTEVIRFDVLERIWRVDQNAAWREHVTSYIHRNAEEFSIRCVTSKIDYSQFRWTVDTPQDLHLIKLIYDHFGNDRFSWQEALRLVERHPEWSDINRDVRQKAIV